MTARTYEFRVSGRMSAQTCAKVSDFDEVRIVPAPPETLIYGHVPDAAHLPGILRLCGSLGLRVRSLRQTPEGVTDGW